MRDEKALEAIVRVAVDRIAVRIRRGPAVVVNRHVMRIGGVTDEVSEHAGVADDVGLDEAARLRRGEPPLPPLVGQLLGHLGDAPRQEAGP